MKKIENDCCGCAVPAYPCRGDSCPLRHVEHFYCDQCGDETTLYSTDDGELCADCILSNLPVVKGSEI